MMIISLLRRYYYKRRSRITDAILHRRRVIYIFVHSTMTAFVRLAVVPIEIVHLGPVLEDRRFVCIIDNDLKLCSPQPNGYYVHVETQ